MGRCLSLPMDDLRDCPNRLGRKIRHTSVLSMKAITGGSCRSASSAHGMEKPGSRACHWPRLRPYARRHRAMWIVIDQELRKYRAGNLTSTLPLNNFGSGAWNLFEDSEGNVWIRRNCSRFY